jgi:mRNA interferase MazF
MARFVRGDVVVLPFPFSDLSQNKRRPALVVAEAGGDELLLCQITSQDVHDRHAVALNPADFRSGSLTKASNVRLNRIFTADSDIILYCAGHVVPEKTASVVEELVAILRGGAG